MKNQTYQQEMWTLPKDAIYAACESIKIGIENSEELLADYDARYGRDHRTNKMSAERMEEEIAQMKRALKGLNP